MALTNRCIHSPTFICTTIIAILTLFSIHSHANTVLPIQTSKERESTTEKHAERTIVKLYNGFGQPSKLTMTDRLDKISAQFLGKPYLLGALGEGVNARYDQSPLYRIDAFDCETFVDTVLAIAFANNVDGFKQCIRKVRYWQGHAKFTSRNHFTDLDWNQNNQQQGYIKDITMNFKDINNQTVALIASAVIDKPSWYQHFTTANIKLRLPNQQEQEKRLAELKIKGSKLPVTESKIPYIPLSALFDSEGQPNNALFAQIPNAALIEIIRPNWDLRDKIGTCLNISHLGFVFWKNGQPLFRQASSQSRSVADVPLINYLNEARQSPSIKGINIQIIVPKIPVCA